MRTSLNSRHNFDKEIYQKFDSARPGSKNQHRSEENYSNPPFENPIKKTRMLARGDFSDKNQGSFAFHYEGGQEFRTGIKIYNRSEQDPIKPPEYIPPAQFKRLERNPILEGEVKREPELRQRPDQISRVFGGSRTESRQNNERKRDEKNKSSIFQDFIPEAKAVRGSTQTQAGELIEYRYAPNYRDVYIASKPSDSRYDKGELKQYDELKSFAGVMKEKRNISSVFN